MGARPVRPSRSRRGLTPGRTARRARRRSAGAVVDRAFDLGLELDVAAQEVVVLLAKRLGVAALARFGPPGLGELVEAVDQLLGVGERPEQRSRPVGLDQVDVAGLAGAQKAQ